jgi:hypothetical protein
MPCSISPWAISARSMPASNHTGRAERAALGMVHGDVGAAQQIGNALAARALAATAEGADLDIFALPSIAKAW